MNKAYRYRIYPSAEQALLIRKTFGCVRFLYNQMLAERKGRVMSSIEPINSASKK